ncbi:MAG: pyridoxal phosphate-dependent aminotransferase [Anaerolineae bacterium]|nr:MAG: pyridoxal phosphate-dependent aminotransferase [Anaerolineae bacterium]
MRISDLAASVSESATMKFNDRANQLRADGKPVIHLGIGEPKNRAPETALAASSDKLEDGFIKYTAAAGLPSLRSAIADYTTERYGREVPAMNVVASNGSKHALFNVLMAIVNPGDKVLMPVPYWVTYPEMVKLVRGSPTFVQPEPGSLMPEVDSVIQAVDDNTAAVLLNSPNNPTGMVASGAFLEKMVGFCEDRGVYLIMDDIYRELVFDGGEAPSAYRYTTKGVDTSHVIVISGVSKLYGMTGFRLGWSVAPAEVTSAINKLQGQMTSNASVISQAAAEGALTGDQNVVEELRTHLEANRDRLLDELAGLDGLKVERPQGGLYSFPDFSAFNPDSLALAEFLLEKALVVTVPGAEFGMDGHLRLGFAGTPEDVVEGARRIKWALDPGQPPEIKMGDEVVTRDWN